MIEEQTNNTETFTDETKKQLIHYMLDVRRADDEARAKLKEANPDLHKMMVENMSGDENPIYKVVWFVIDNAPRYETTKGYDTEKATEEMLKVLA